MSKPKSVSSEMAESIRRALRYDPETGKVFWHADWFPEVTGGGEAGYVDRRYIVVTHLRRRLFAHRIAWLFLHGEWPQHPIDHIDGDGTNNRPENLRAASQSRNVCNRYGWTKQAHGFKGVSKRGAVYVAQIRHEKKLRYLGTFKCPTAAALAYDRAALEIQGEFARPNLLRRA